MKAFFVSLIAFVVIFLASPAKALEAGDEFPVIFSEQVWVANLEPINLCSVIVSANSHAYENCKIIHAFGDTCFLMPDGGLLRIILHGGGSKILLEYKNDKYSIPSGSGECFGGINSITMKVIMSTEHVLQLQTIAEERAEREREEKKEHEEWLRDFRVISERLHKAIEKQ